MDRSSGLICDQLVELEGFYSHQGFPERLRRIVYRDPERDKRLVFFWPTTSRYPRSPCARSTSRWQVELFFKWIKQHLPGMNPFLRHLGERTQDAGLDRRQRLRVGGHHPQAANLALSLQFDTANSSVRPFNKNP